MEQESFGVLQFLALIQGAYYFLTGIWPLIHRPSFLMVTGPKKDLWLVNTVGSLLAVIGLSLMASAVTAVVGTAVLLLAFGSALALTIIEIVYVSIKTISSIYLLDSAVEVGFMLFWIGLFF